MRKFAIFTVIAAIAVVGVAFYVSQRDESASTDIFFAWCDSIYHQNIGCPKHGQVKIPLAVLAKQEVDHLIWCDSIYHQNIGCPYFFKRRP